MRERPKGGVGRAQRPEEASPGRDPRPRRGRSQRRRAVGVTARHPGSLDRAHQGGDGGPDAGLCVPRRQGRPGPRDGGHGRRARAHEPAQRKHPPLDRARPAATPILMTRGRHRVAPVRQGVTRPAQRVPCRPRPRPGQQAPGVGAPAPRRALPKGERGLGGPQVAQRPLERPLRQDVRVQPRASSVSVRRGAFSVRRGAFNPQGEDHVRAAAGVQAGDGEGEGVV